MGHSRKKPMGVCSQLPLPIPRCKIIQGRFPARVRTEESRVWRRM